jgi:thermitase
MATIDSFSARAGTAALVLLSAALLAAVPAAAQPANAQRAAHSTSDASRQNARLLVKFDKRTPQLSRRQTLKRLGAKQVETLGPLGVVAVEVSRPRAHSVLEALRASQQVSFAERDGVAHAVLAPNDPYFNASASPCVSSLGCWPYQNANLPNAWDVTNGSSAVVVAVVDTGVDASQPDLSSAVLGGYNFVAGNSDTTDDNGHGTEVAVGIAARSGNSVGIPGVCGQCQILPVKVLDASGSGSTANVALGITWAADHGAQVINLSLASTYADPLLHDAINYAIGKGVLVVSAAGNAGSNSPTVCNGGCGGFPAAFAAYADANGGAAIENGLVSVGAADYNDNLYSFSNHGSWVLLSAPGCSLAANNDGGFDGNGVCGTSIASSFVAGAAGLLLSYRSSLTLAQLQSALTSSTTHYAGLDVATGELNVYGALEAAGYSPPPVAPTGYPKPSAIRLVPLGTGGVTVGSKLTVSPTLKLVGLRYRWQVRGAKRYTNLSGQTAPTLSLTSALTGKQVRVIVTNGKQSRISAPTTPIRKH